MGIDIPSMQLLCCAKNIGVDFSDTITIGRQTVVGAPDAVASVLSAVNISREQSVAILEGQFAESLFALLGAKHVSSVDASDYEKASHVHDFNQPLPAVLVNRFSVVHDGGTLEHVFNVPQALKNCMEMVRVGGHFIQVTVANNCMGHGFWQFSPDLIYRVFSRENGFQAKIVLLHELNMSGVSVGTWYKVDDPSAHPDHSALINGQPIYICTIAQRVEDAKIFAHCPQQSSYVHAWKQVQGPRTEILAPEAEVDPSGRSPTFKKSRALEPPYHSQDAGSIRPSVLSSDWQRRPYAWSHLTALELECGRAGIVVSWLAADLRQFPIWT